MWLNHHLLMLLVVHLVYWSDFVMVPKLFVYIDCFNKVKTSVFIHIYLNKVRYIYNTFVGNDVGSDVGVCVGCHVGHSVGVLVG